MIKITFPNSDVKDYKKNSTPLDIVKSISKSLEKETIFAIVNGVVFDMHTPITKSSEITFIKDIDDYRAKELINHTTAHIFAMAIKDIYPKAQIVIGPAIQGGFHYDFDLGDEEFSSKDLPKIEKKMKKIISGGAPMSRGSFENASSAIKQFNDNPYKTKIIEGLTSKGEKDFSYYKIGDFTDLCKGPHLPKISFIKEVKLFSNGGAYFQGDKANKMINRVYGIGCFSKSQLEEEIRLREERKERDHRLIGKAQKIFTFSDSVGKGLPIWLPNGYFMISQIRNFITELENKYYYQQVSTPVIGSKELYVKSGHLEHYKDDMFPVMEVNDESFVLRPMSCPHHAIIFDSELRSYRELPFRISEEVNQYRYESSGSLIGLERVRSMTLTDSHVFITEEQINDEIKHTYKLISEALERFNIKIDYIELALHDSDKKEKYHSDAKVWKSSEDKIEQVAKEIGISYIKKKGEAAFYGPKIDIQVKTSMGHIITMSTIQLDFLLAKKFDLKYKSADGSFKQPVTIHRGLIGSYERFISILLEQTKGVLPLWLVNNQVSIMPVNNDLHLNKAFEIKEILHKEGIRASVDSRNERLSYKIRESQTSKTPFQIVVGDNELETDSITVRKYSQKETETVHIDEFFKYFEKDKLYK